MTPVTLGRGHRPSTARVLATAGTDDLGDVLHRRAGRAPASSEVKVRSVLHLRGQDRHLRQVLRPLAGHRQARSTSARRVGIIAAQSIGEPGTQLTMRTFHTGGVAPVDDITQGLPRVVELFEARSAQGVAPDLRGHRPRVEIEETEKTQGARCHSRRRIGRAAVPGLQALPAPGRRRRPRRRRRPAHRRVPSTRTTCCAILGVRGLSSSTWSTRSSRSTARQGVSIHDKHIEIIIRQMLRRVTVIESGDAELLPGRPRRPVLFEEENRRVVAEGGQPASGRPRARWASPRRRWRPSRGCRAASFQETTRVLTDAAIHGRSDRCVGLKENVIIGKLIPAGTGLQRYRNIRVEPTEEAKAAMCHDDAV